MSRLPTVGAREVVAVVLRLGFEFDRQRGSHAVYIRRSDRRRIVIPIHKGRDLKPGTLRGIIDDLGLTVEQFVSMS